ncbi:hypothetical protein P280DRAFT_3772 [Massarina eburnea CBS 473.64]|uniref:Uncharacterized protein n=1 Tax=Massarina eburnea CBS 473.64 TaxID=1395130 RepID=A0A6A6SEI4_9PLEO|nr:hypothetical protein P280DRAFT_3772 [Massarina eburnea CBS 473.64]
MNTKDMDHRSRSSGYRTRDKVYSEKKMLKTWRMLGVPQDANDITKPTYICARSLRTFNPRSLQPSSRDKMGIGAGSRFVFVQYHGQSGAAQWSRRRCSETSDNDGEQVAMALKLAASCRKRAQCFNDGATSGKVSRMQDVRMERVTGRLVSN